MTENPRKKKQINFNLEPTNLIIPNLKIEEPIMEPIMEPTIEPTAVTSEEPEVLEPIMESTVEQNIEEQTIIEPQKTKKNRKKKTA